jgi:hypothetical protein
MGGVAAELVRTEVVILPGAKWSNLLFRVARWATDIQLIHPSQMPTGQKQPGC